MELTQKIAEDSIIIGISGRLDTTYSVLLENKLMELITRQGLHIVVNCREMDYISSSGLRVLLMALKKSDEVNSKFVLCCLKEDIREIFEISGFSSIFRIFGSEEEALKAF